MKVLLIFNQELKLNKSSSYIKETEQENSFDRTFEVNPRYLKNAVKLLLKEHCDITEIVTVGKCSTPRKFRKVYADTIDFLERSNFRNSEHQKKTPRPVKQKFDISDKDKELLKKEDVTHLESAFAKFKPKAKSMLKLCKDYWHHLKTRVKYKKKIVVFLSQYGFVFTTGGVNFLALTDAENETISGARAFLKDKLKDNEPDTISELPSKSNRFIHNRVPLRTDDARENIRKIVQFVAVVAFVVAGSVFLYNSVYKSVQNTAIQSEIQSIYYDGDVSKAEKSKDHKKNFDKLKSINKEIVAWIQIDHTNIDYPVLYHKGDTLYSQYYLYNDYRKNYSDFGSIFIDFRSQQGAKSKNVIMHGHHMMDGSMFSNLLKYGKTSIDLDFYKKSPTITFSTPDKGTDVYKIISVYKTTGYKYDTDFFNYLQGDFTSDAEFLNYVYNVRARSMVNCPVDVNEDDTLITLSTCSYEVHEGYRTIVVARRTRDGESKKVEVSKATKNKHPYFPSGYYYRFGGTQPKLTSFKTEYKKGNISWYDGDGKIKGKQTLTGGKFVRDRTTTTKKETSSTKKKTTSSTKPSTKKTTKPSTTKPTKPTKPSTTKPSTTKPTEPKVNYYTVKFLNAYGNVMSTQKIKEGSSAKAPTPPKKASDETYKYTFLKWDKSFANVKHSITVKPVYKKTKIVEPTTTTVEPTTTTETEPVEQED